jgi:hypothetical protein
VELVLIFFQYNDQQQKLSQSPHLRYSLRNDLIQQYSAVDFSSFHITQDTSYPFLRVFNTRILNQKWDTAPKANTATVTQKIFQPEQKNPECISVMALGLIHLKLFLSRVPATG